MIVSPVNVPGGIELVTPFEPREIQYAFHDIDGTHSLIRDWVPVMTLTLGWVTENGLPEAEGEDAVSRILADRDNEFPEALRFSIESAGLSALTQMEWAIRRALENGRISGIDFDPDTNRKIIAGIWSGQEEFDEFPESPEVKRLIWENSSRLFRIYEKLLLVMSRDRNLADARTNGERWRVPGSMEFLRFLRDSGVRNYFVTGAVVESDSHGGFAGTMFEEISALGYEIGPGELIESLEGSSWQEKLPKAKIMRRLCEKLNVSPGNVLIVGDGRSEIEAGRQMDAVTISRLPESAARAREIHVRLGTNFILEEYCPKVWNSIFSR